MNILQHVRSKRFPLGMARCFAASLALVAVTAVCQRLHLNLALVSLLFVIIIVLESRAGSLASSLLAAGTATLGLTYIAPPAYSFRVDDPFDDLAIATFFGISIVISQLVSKLRRMTEEAISTVDRKLIEAEERERVRIARELHDDFNQRMHSSKLEYLGLAAAVSGLCRELSQQHGLDIDIHCDAVPKGLPAHVAVTLFRVLQEALQNVLKHSGSAQVNVVLTGTPDGIELSVRDSGTGFNPKLAMKGTGLGLVSMQERIKLIRGEFAIHSEADKGTTIQAKVPLGDLSGAPN